MFDSDPADDRGSNRLARLLTFVGSIAGILALTWNIAWTISNEQQSYLVLSLELRRGSDPMKPIAVASIENKGQFSKPVDYAALIVSPTGWDIRRVIAELRECNHEQTSISLSNEPASSVLAYVPKPDGPLYCEGPISIIPLTFFYKEQSRIGNEKLTSSVLIDEGKFRDIEQSSQAYDVRLIVTGQGRARTTLDLLTR